MCKFRLVTVVSADNPQQSELASHIGPKGNCPCRKCKVGGPGVFKESDIGFESLHKVWDNIVSASRGIIALTGGFTGGGATE